MVFIEFMILGIIPFYYIINSCAEGAAAPSTEFSRNQFNDSIRMPFGKADSDKVAAKAACGFSVFLLYHISAKKSIQICQQFVCLLEVKAKLPKIREKAQIYCEFLCLKNPKYADIICAYWG